MSNAYLANFLQLAKRIVKAERGLAVNSDATIITMSDLDEADLNAGDMMLLVKQIVGDALSTNEAILGNNIIRDPSKAPNTNTAFRNLRLVVAIPVGGLGAIYMDRQVRDGVMQREDIEQLQRFGAYLVEQNLLDLSVEDMFLRYQNQDATTG